MTGVDEAIRLVVELSKGMKDIPFPVLVEATTGHRVIPLNLSDPADRRLVELITESATNFVKICARTRRRFKGDRINEVGRAIEEEFVQELMKTPLRAELLGRAGYPDMKVVDELGRVTYLESKAVSKNNPESSLRVFYYSGGDKIDSDARHLLICWVLAEEEDKYWRVTGWRLSDLYRLRINLKAEFNASYKELYSRRLLVSEYSLEDG